MENDLISRQAAMEEISKQQTYKMFEGEDTLYFDANDVGSVLASLPSAQPELAQNLHNACTDLISRHAAIGVTWEEPSYTDPMNVLTEVRDRIKALPPAQPDNRLSKIADLVEGTIDHFDLDDAMDLLYQIKEVLK